MNYEYCLKWFKSQKLIAGLAEYTAERWEPISHSYDNNDYKYCIMFRRSLLSEEITS
jgi:hypothetical protein